MNSVLYMLNVVQQHRGVSWWGHLEGLVMNNNCKIVYNNYYCGQRKQTSLVLTGMMLYSLTRTLAQQKEAVRKYH